MVRMGMRTAREAEHEYWRQKQDEAFERNRVIRLKMWGVGIAILGIVFQIVANDIWWSLISVPIVATGLYLMKEDWK